MDIEHLHAGLSTLPCPWRNLFFTVNLLERYPNNVLVRHIDILRTVLREVRKKGPPKIYFLPLGKKSFTQRYTSDGRLLDAWEMPAMETSLYRQHYKVAEWEWSRCGMALSWRGYSIYLPRPGTNS